MLGTTIGALSGGKLMTIGRRIPLLFCDIIGLFGIGLTMYFDFPALIIGRFIFGLSSGFFASIVPRYIEDMVPNKYHYLMATLFYIAGVSGSLIAFSMGEILPKDKDKSKLIATDNWRIIFFYFPGAFLVFHFIA